MRLQVTHERSVSIVVIPTDIELVLIVAISGLIAISVYILYLVDKLISRIEVLEKSISSSLSVRSQKPEGLEPLKKTVSSLVDQINAVNEVLESTGKDIDSVNVKISSCINGLATADEKIDSTEDKIYENKNELMQIRREISAIGRKLEQLEKETDVISARQQIAGEF
jgi:chromosome segregation ATPase